ncbi:hypothetical protein GIB67_029704 [Kingdonia uniflora]|uniref:Uncharacterized protein n=1 Tax=Kingdonia uniflora TaxID=39325 RepID=A0A7J7LLJ0_9MAGN|nr:hypothetical protein GIB67_029704 [Kingdonia uniflora]
MMASKVKNIQTSSMSGLNMRYAKDLREIKHKDVKLSGGDTMDRRNSAKKMTTVQISIARKAKRVIENLCTINNLNPRVPDEARKLALMTTGKDWHEHKVQKRKVIDIEDDLEQVLANCPEDVPYDQWEVFVVQCTTSEYKDQIDAGEVDLTVLFGPECTGRVRVTGFGISLMVYNSIQQSGVLVQSLQEEVKELREEVVLVQGLKDEIASLRVHMAKLENFMVSIQIALKENVPLARGNGHLKTIGDACGSFVAWPTPIIIKE